MSTTALLTLLATLACPALTAACLYRATHRATHRARATALAWLLAPAGVVGSVLGAQHTHGWGVMGWMVQLATAVICLVHLSGIKVKMGKKRRQRKAKGGRTERFLQIPLQAVVQWGKDFAGGHRPFHQPRQTVAEHRSEVSGQVLDPRPEDDDRPEWERIMNDILYGEPEEEQPEYNVVVYQTVDEHKAQLQRQLES